MPNLPAVEVPRIMQAIRLVSEGKTASEAIIRCGVTWAQWYRWTKKEPLAEMLAQAVQHGYDVMAEMLINIDQVHSDPAMANVISKNIQWFLARMKPSRYGDRVINEHHITADKEIIEALLRAKDRAQTIVGSIAATALPHPTRNERLSDQDVTDIEVTTEEEQEALDLAALY